MSIGNVKAGLAQLYRMHAAECEIHIVWIPNTRILEFRLSNWDTQRFSLLDSVGVSIVVCSRRYSPLEAGQSVYLPYGTLVDACLGEKSKEKLLWWTLFISMGMHFSVHYLFPLYNDNGPKQMLLWSQPNSISAQLRYIWSNLKQWSNPLRRWILPEPLSQSCNTYHK